MGIDQVSARQIEFALFSSFQACESIVLEETMNLSRNAHPDHTSVDNICQLSETLLLDYFQLTVICSRPISVKDTIFIPHS
jgi:hypothetical protein